MKHIAYWTGRSSERESLKFIKELALSHAAEGGTQGLAITDLIDRNCYHELCEFRLNYTAISPHHAYHCRQALAFYQKCTYLPLKVDRKKAAADKFRKAEEACRLTNEIFKLRDEGKFNFLPSVDSAITRARRKISRVLGVLPKLEDLGFKFGPGATTLTKKKNASVAEKLSAGFSCSEDLLPYASRILEEMPEYLNLHESESKTRVTPVDDGEWHDEFGYVPVLITPGRVNFVPKDAKTDRTVIVEGSLNVIIQGAIGRYMSSRLRASGIDLSDQTINQEWARQGSLNGCFGTLDLVSASDMMAIAIVKELLPWEWYFFLSTMRSSKVILEGNEITQEKFSSMGNGYTFPLQSLIFWALSSSVDDPLNDEFASVYGDDIIVHSRNSPAVASLLQTVGFEVNDKKSYWTGPFRESCGADYLSGINIRPWYHRDVITPADLFRLHNYYVRRGFKDRANAVRRQINPGLRIYGPDGYGDGHLLGDWIPKRHKCAESRGYGGVLFDTFKLKPVRDKRIGRLGDRVLPVYSIYVRENADEVLLPPSRIFNENGLDAGLKPVAYANYLRIVKRMQNSVAVEALPERYYKREGLHVKACSLPGTDGYVKVSIYTFDSTAR